MTNTAKQELKPCPHCGDSAWFSGYTVQCDSCGAQLVKASQGSTIEAWNTRAPQWQPISTVPEDETLVDLWHKQGWRLPECVFLNGSWRDMQGERLSYSDFDIADFTHWMPLPKAPGVE